MKHARKNVLIVKGAFWMGDLAPWDFRMGSIALKLVVDPDHTRFRMSFSGELGWVGCGGVKNILSTDILSHAHSHPPFRNIGNMVDGISSA